jgi:hypothetical protein
MQATCPNDQHPSPDQQLVQLKAKLRHADAERDAVQFQLFHARVSYEAEVQSCQALKQGLEDLQRECVQLGAGYRSRYEECSREIERLQARCVELGSDNDQLRKHLQITDDLVACYKRLLDISEGSRQQQPASSLPHGWLVPPQNDGPNLCGQISLPPLSFPPPSFPPTSFPPPSLPLSLPPLSLNREFVIDPTSLRPLDDLDYSIGTAVDPPFGTDLVTSASASPFEDPTQNQSVQSGLRLSSTQHNAPSSPKTGEGRGSGGKEEKPSKKRKSK